MCLMKVMRQGSELHGLASYINKYNWLCVFLGGVGKENPALRPGLQVTYLNLLTLEGLCHQIVGEFGSSWK